MERNNRNILVALIAVVIVAAVFSSFGLSLFAGPTPQIVLPTPAPTEQAPGKEEQDSGVRVEVSPDTVQSVIAALDRQESYSRVVTSTLEVATAATSVWVDGGWTRADMILPTGRIVHTIVGNGRVWRWYDNDPATVTWAADGASVDVEGQRIPTYEDVLELDKSLITAAGYEEKNGYACVYVQADIPELDQRERYWVSSDNGLLVAAETETGGQVVYSMASDAPEIPVSAQASFSLPDGTVLHTVGEAAGGAEE